jgi:hypothetical protein
VPSLPILALPVEQFEDFARFARTAVPAQDWMWTFAEAAKVATSILYALGQPSVIEGSEEADALRHWLVFFGSEDWRQASIRVYKLPIAPIEDSMSFAFGNPAAGFGLGAWAPVNHAVAVKRLNAWCLRALGDFYTALRTAAPSGPGDTPSDVAMPVGDAAGTAMPPATPAPATSNDEPPIASEAGAAWAYLERLTKERQSTEHPPTRADDYFEWAPYVRRRWGFPVTQQMIDDWRRILLTDDEKRGGAPPRRHK